METTTPETISAPDLTARKNKALAAYDEILERIQALHDALEGVSPGARADLMFVKSMLAFARIKI